MDLKEENKILKQKLDLAKTFINREIKSHIKNISSQKLQFLGAKNRENFFDENIEEIISTLVEDYFPETMIFSIDKSIIENIISAEVFYHNLIKNDFLDGVSVINSYQKAIDFLVEQNITSLFRKFAKRKHTPLLKNDLTEKNLHSIVENGYSLGFTRLFSIIQDIKNNSYLYDYGTIFREFLEKYTYIKDIILSKNFFDLSKEIADSDLFGAKRHKSKITLQEVKKARKIIIGDFREKNSIIYYLASIGEV